MDKPNFDDLTPVNKIIIAGRGSAKASKFVKELMKENPNLFLEPIGLEKIDEIIRKNDALYKKYVLGDWGKGGNDE